MKESNRNGIHAKSIGAICSEATLRFERDSIVAGESGVGGSAMPWGLVLPAASAKVRLAAENLCGIEGLVTSVSDKRVNVLIEILGGHRKMSVEHRQLQLVHLQHPACPAGGQF